MKKRQGVSLIVLVITIIVMIILAASVVITLSNTGIINRANKAINLTNEKQVQDLAALIWTEEYTKMLEVGNVDEIILENNVKGRLLANGINEDNWTIIVTSKGTTIRGIKELGEQITAKDYGKKVNYEANGITDWKIFYHTNEYVYLIASEKVEYDKLPTDIPGATYEYETVSINNTNKKVGELYWTGDQNPATVATIQNPKMWMANWVDYNSNKGARCASYFLDETYWKAFKNTTANYASYVKGVIGTPTLEMFIASWNAKREATNDTITYDKKLSLTTNGTVGYYLDDITSGDAVSSNKVSQTIATIDSLYIWSTKASSSIWLATPAGDYNVSMYFAGYVGKINSNGSSSEYFGVRPVVCLKKDVPAREDVNGNFII